MKGLNTRPANTKTTFAKREKAIGQITMMNFQRNQVLDQDRKHREEKGIYQAPNLMLHSAVSILSVLIIIGVMIVVLHLF